MLDKATISQLAGCTLLAAEAASFASGQPVLIMFDIAELISMGAFDHIFELFKDKRDVEEIGLISYLREAVKQLHLVDSVKTEGPKQKTAFGRERSSLFHSRSLFSSGMAIKYCNFVKFNY